MKSDLISLVPVGSSTLSGLLWHPSPPWLPPGGEGHQQGPLCLCPVEPGRVRRGPCCLGLPQEPSGLPGGSEHHLFIQPHSLSCTLPCAGQGGDTGWLRWPQALSS